MTHKELTAASHHRPVDARGLNEWEYRELLRRRGLSLAPVIASRPKVGE